MSHPTPPPQSTQSVELRAGGLLLDLDGTLIDSSAVVRYAWQTWCAEQGVDFASIAHLIHGRPANETMALILPNRAHELNDADNARMLAYETTHTEGVVALPGAAELLDALARHAAPHAVVTACTRTLARTRLDAAGLTPPETLVTSDEVSAGKPDPEGYRTGAERLGLPATEGLVLEDAPAGVAAAHAAGMHCVGVGRHSAEGDELPACWVQTPHQVRLVGIADDGALRVELTDAVWTDAAGGAQG